MIIFNLSENDKEFLKIYFECNMSQRLTANCLNCSYQNITYYLNKIHKKIKPLNPRDMKDLLLVVESIDGSVSRLLEGGFK